MGMKLMAFKCDNCGQMMSETIGPTYTFLQDAPTAPGWAVVVLTCFNMQCQNPIGTYTFPTQSSG